MKLSFELSLYVRAYTQYLTKLFFFLFLFFVSLSSTLQMTFRVYEAGSPQGLSNVHFIINFLTSFRCNKFEGENYYLRTRKKNTNFYQVLSKND